MANICSTKDFESIVSDLSLYMDDLKQFVYDEQLQKPTEEIDNAKTIETIDEYLGEYGVNLKELINLTEDENSLNDLKQVLNDGGIDYSGLLDSRLKESSTINNIVSIFRSPEVAPLFHTMHVAENYFEKSINEKMIEAVLLGTGDKFVSTNGELNNNIKTLKNDLFNKIRSYLNLPTVNLYDANGKFNEDLYDTYQQTIKEFEETFNRYDKITSFAGNKIPIFRSNIRSTESRNLLDAYNAAIFLVNFDNIIESKFGDLMTVEYSTFNSFKDPSGNSNKYQLKVKGITEVYWKGDTHEEESVERNEVKLAKMIVESVKLVNDKGDFTGEYLEMKDFYSFAALVKDFELTNYNELKQEFEDWKPFNENPTEGLNWYINNIKDYHSNKLVNKTQVDKWSKFDSYFEHKLDFVNSISRFFDDYNIEQKESLNEGSVKALFTQIINNSVGATYLIYNAEKKIFQTKEMHKHKTNTIAVQNSIYSHMVSNSKIFSDAKDEKEIEKIKENLPTDIVINGEVKLSDDKIKQIGKYLKYKFGLSLTYENVSSMMQGLSENNGNNLTSDMLISNLQTVSNTINKLLPDVEKNQDLVKDNYSESESESEVITSLINHPFVQEVIKKFLKSYPMKPLMNIDTLSGEKIPVFKTATLTYNDVSLMRSHEKFFEGKDYKSIFIDNNKSILLGTGTKLEVIRGNDNIGAGKFSISESFTSNMAYDFYKSLGAAQKDTYSKGGFSVMIGNYSDKSTILTKIISYDAKFKDSDTTVIKSSSDELLSKVREQSFNYYSDLFSDIFDQYNKLFELIGRPERLNKKYKANSAAFDENIDIISKYLLEGTLAKDLNKAFKNEDPNNRTLNFVEEIHYSSYFVTNTKGEKNKVSAMNQLLVDYFKIFRSEDLFKRFVKSQENSLIDKYEDTFKSNYIDFQENSNEGVKQYCEYVGIDYKNEYLPNFVESTKKDNVEKHKHLLKGKDGNLNPLIKKWLWVNGLFRNEYLYMSGKGEYMHPHKIKDFEFRGANVTMEDKKVTNYTSISEKAPTKKGESDAKYEEYHDKLFDKMYSELSKEMSGRLSSMAKRNVVFTATIELPARKTRFGVPENINLAVIQDYEAQVYNQSGMTKNQEVHDGASMLNYVYSRMVNASYPAKGYRNTKKEFGTLITPFGAVVKKDAETVITNQTIRNSNNSTIKLRDKQRQMLSLGLNDVDFNQTEDGYTYHLPVKDKLFIKDGSTYKIDHFNIKDGNMTVYTINTKTGEQANFTNKVNTLFDIWEMFGGEYSVDGDGNYTEGSNDLLYDLVTSFTNQNDEYVLKNKMIHIISNKSAIKSGSSNLNSKDAWTDGNMSLMYSTFEHRHMGPQLDASHDSDGSEVREITQVISALAQNMDTADDANEVYSNLSKIIAKAAEPYKKLLIGDAKDEQTLYDYVSRKFFDSVTRGNNVSLAKTIMESFPPNIQIPYSNQNFFQLFVKDIITRMNNEFITRYYSGIGAVLNPSHGMIQVYEDKNGNIITHSDLTKNALKDYSDNNRAKVLLDETGQPMTDENGNYIFEKKSNEDIIRDYLNATIEDNEISVDKFNPGESYIDDAGVVQTLDTIQKYYDFKTNNEGRTFTRSHKTTRDLKPSELNFSVKRTANIIDPIKANEERSRRSNLLSKASRLAPKANTINELISELVSLSSSLRVVKNNPNAEEEYISLVNDLVNEFGESDTNIEDVYQHIQEVYDEDIISGVESKVDKNVNLFDTESIRLRYQLSNLLNPKTAGKVSSMDLFKLQQFAKSFGINWDLKNKESIKRLNLYLNAWTQRNTELIERNKVMKDSSEFIVINENGESSLDFKQLFGTDSLVDDVLSDVINNYGEHNTENIYNKTFKAAELILPNLYKSSFNVGNYSISEIKKEGPKFFKDKIKTAFTSTDTENDIKLLLGDGESEIYIKFVKELPAQTKDLTIKKDLDVVYEKDEEGNEISRIKPTYTRLNKNGDKLYTLPENAVVTIENGKEVISIKATTTKSIKIKDEPVKYLEISKDLNDDLDNLISSFGGKIANIIPLMNSTLDTRKFTKDELVKSNINQVSLNLFKRFSGFTQANSIADNEWLENNVDVISEQLGNKMYASWEKSHEFVAARIPAQSMQSFMEMKNISYFDTDSNDAYVSIWQIFLQGSDFDIDKAYIVGYGFDKHAHYETTSDVFNYSTKSQLDTIERLPMPSGNKAVLDPAGVDLNEEFTEFENYINANPELAKSNLFSEEVVNAFGSALSKIAGINKINIVSPNTKNVELFVKLINKHNTSNKVVKSRHALKNSVVSKIRKIISAPSNQLLANIPVDVEEWHDAVSEYLKYEEEREDVQDGIITKDDKIIWGHPAIGKTEALKQNQDLFLDWDNLFNDKRDKWIEKKSKTKKGTEEFKAAKNEYLVNYSKHSDFVKFVTEEWNKAKSLATKEDKKLIASPHMLLDLFESDFDKIINIPDNVFVDRNVKRGETDEYNSKLWKAGINKTLNKVSDKSKIVTTDKFISELLPKKRVKKQNLLSSWDMFSMFKQQRDAAIGKDDVGIAANGLKVFFALNTYYNNIYTKDAKLPEQLNGDNLRKSSHVFLKNLYLPTRNAEGKWEWTYNDFTTISDINIKKSQLDNINQSLGINSKARKSFAALYQSAFTSAATDNAKELLMAKVNANVELASMHLYMLSLGIEPDQIAIFMNSDVAKDVVSRLDSNLFESNESSMVGMILGNLAKKKDFSAEFKTQLKSFTDIYNAAQEFKVLAKILGVNQKTSANTIELHKYLTTFDKVMLERENTLFGDKLWKLQKWNNWDNVKAEDIDKLKIEVAQTIIQANPLFNDTDVSYIIGVLDEVSNVDHNGKSESVIGGNFDFRKYFEESPEGNYKNAVKKYYNLIKNTINIFDVIDSVPHFKSMIDGVVVSHNILLKSSKKYNFVFNDAINLSKKYASMVSEKNEVKNMYGNKNLALKFDEKQIRRAMMAYDKFTIQKWFQGYKADVNQNPLSRFNRKISDISFKVSDLLKIAGLDSVTLAKNNEAKQKSPFDENQKEWFVEVKKLPSGEYENGDFIVDLLSDTGIANFKVLMEQVIPEILKKDEYSNNFIDSLRVQTMKNPFGLITNQLIASFNLSNLNNPVNIEKFQNLLSDFNSLEHVKQLNNSNGTQVNWRDLFYIYNLAVNNESYGDKRLTPLFEDYMKERTSLGYDFLLYSSKVDSGEINIFNANIGLEDKETLSVDEKLSLDKVNRSIDQSLLYYLYSENGKLAVNDLFNESSDNIKVLTVSNGNYVIVSELNKVEQTLDKLKNINKVLNWIKSNALVVTFNCD